MFTLVTTELRPRLCSEIANLRQGVPTSTKNDPGFKFRFSD